MGCDHPLTGYRSRDIGPSGKRRITFDRNASFSAIPIKLPCGQCMGCRLEHSRQWAIRAVHEAQMYDYNSFLTLTYNNAHLPTGGSLVRRDPMLFLKRLRKKYGRGIRFYGCGEYGEQSNRPHYHFVLFNFRPRDLEYYKTSRSGERLYTSRSITELWPFGFNVVGDVSFKSCAYVARYVTTKLNGDAAAKYGDLLKPFSMMSRMPGIGSTWFTEYGEHAYKWDSVVMNGREIRPPRFYDTRYEILDSDHMALLKRKRRRIALEHASDNTSARRHVKEDVLRLNLKIREM